MQWPSLSNYLFVMHGSNIISILSTHLFSWLQSLLINHFYGPLAWGWGCRLRLSVPLDAWWSSHVIYFSSLWPTFTLTWLEGWSDSEAVRLGWPTLQADIQWLCSGEVPLKALIDSLFCLCAISFPCHYRLFLSLPHCLSAFHYMCGYGGCVMASVCQCLSGQPAWLEVL